MSYFKLNKERTVYSDVDDTILLWNPEHYQHKPDELIYIHDEDRVHCFLPHKKHIEFLWKLKAQGYGIVIFSAAGGEWADKIVKQLGLLDLPDVVMSKPEFVIDDLLDASKIIKSVLWIDPNTGEFKRNK